jgi:FtsP/CotA-like multicopper oxidase with cupredoxin domain
LLDFSFVFLARAQGLSTPLVEPPICSKDKNTAGKTPQQADVCTVTSLGVDALGHEHHEIRLDLTAKTGRVTVGGYSIETEHYNDTYLTPVIEANSGDTVAAHLANLLPPLTASDCEHMHGECGNATNLHYFHGGIVSPQNSRSDDIDASKGPGDNIYVRVESGSETPSTPHSFDFTVPIPVELNGDLLESKNEAPGATTTIPYPAGLNWYHSHLHGLSANQVGGGMSGLLSVGDTKASVAGMTPADTDILKARTKIDYLMLRDLPILSDKLPGLASEGEAATWETKLPAEDVTDLRPNPCVLAAGELPQPAAPDRKGFCFANNNPKSIWLFTVNGQRYPTINIEPGSNHLLRIANLSANFTYTLRLVPEAGGEPYKFDLLTVDGVVPGKPSTSEAGNVPVAATQLTELVLMPAARAEIYVRNDGKTAAEERTFILRTDELDTGQSLPPGQPRLVGDDWPQIQLARVVFKARPAAVSEIGVALSAIRASAQLAEAAARVTAAPVPPAGCIPDINQSALQHRRVTFFFDDQKGFTIKTDIVAPRQPIPLSPPNEFRVVRGTSTGFRSFHDYVGTDGKVNWESEETKHVCVNLATGHRQLWELVNGTSELHNFHIHQMKFRLADDDDFRFYGIDPSAVPKPEAATDCPLAVVAKEGRDKRDVWHDTLPICPGSTVFVIMNFVDTRQLGRFVYHCHILKHEDAGLMAPIEVLP